MVIENKVPSLLLVGGPGLGKSYMVNQVLEQANLSEETDYMIIKGHSSARALFNTLRDNNGKTIIFDDCDSIFKDTSALNILKGALDSYSKRIISWNTAEEPETVEFTGRIIFISNLSLDRIESAILSRSFVVDLDVTKDEMLLRMEEILENVEPRVELSLKQEALELIKANKDVISELNMRSLIKAIRIRNSGVANWEDLLVYSLFN
jgi:replication-associated recombination protein RarA